MPEPKLQTDHTRVVADLAAGMIKDILLLVKAQVFLGPSRGAITKQQALAYLETPEQRQAAIDTIGADALLDQVQELE